MAEDKEPESERSAAVWGTWEELLLACAVKRHGFKDWNSVAMELQTRSSLPHLLTTARNCELKFLDLKRRFISPQNDADSNRNSVGISDNVDSAVPWVDELRKLRVAELRREVHRYDVSINSLQLKVKELEEERKQGLNDSEAGNGNPDLKTESRERRSENDKKLFGEPDRRSGPNGTVAKPPDVAGEDSDREDFSVNQSNSTGSKCGNQKGAKPDFAGSYRPEKNRRAVEPAGPLSDDGSTDTVVKKSTSDKSDTKRKKETKRVDSSELADSEAQSNGGETAATRESSEVQSSASLTGRKIVLKKEISGGSSGNEPRRTAAVKSRRFDEVLEMIRAHKHGSLFESRLLSQETEVYKGMIRQHLDLETVQAKVNSGSYSSSNIAFYRDLLLLCNNAITFFPKSSKESIGACELRYLVSNEMKKSLPFARIDPLPEVVDSAPAYPSQSKGPDLEGTQSLFTKQKSSVPIIVCRKRSKISSKLSTSGLGEKGDRSNDDEKSAIDLKSSIKMASTIVEDQGTTKDNKVKEKPITGARSMRRSNDNATNSTGPSNKKQTTGWKPGSSANEPGTPNSDKKKSEIVALEKKRSAADFLKRIKQNSPAETTKKNGRGGSTNIGNAAAGEQKKGSGKSDKGKEKATSVTPSNDKKRPKEDTSPSKRSVGRPPKKAVEAEPTSTPAKRAREGGGKEPLKRARKRAKKR